jgi:predicted ABC-type ATPase
MPVPELWIVAGPNGAGKTTAVQRAPIAALLEGVSFINPDDRTLLKLRAAEYDTFANTPPDILTRLFLESADEVFRDLVEMIDRCEPVGVETVLSSPKYRPLVEMVMDRGGFVGLVYLSLSSPELARRRVAARVARGGHGVPDDKVEARWQRSLAELAWFAQHVTVFWVYDNSDSDPQHPQLELARGQDGRLTDHSPNAFPEMKAVLNSLPR